MLYRLKQKIKRVFYNNPLYQAIVRFIVRRNQNKLNKKLAHIYQNKLRKIRVGFLVTENEKWCCQTLFDKLKENPHFEPVIVLSSLSGMEHDILKEKFQRNLSFFKRIDENIIEAYDPVNNTFRSLKSFGLDIIFYQQPWNINKIQKPFATSKFALPCYVPYGFEESYRLMKKHVAAFYDILFRFYVTHSSIVQHYKEQGYRSSNIWAVGYPKLEKYLSNPVQEKKYVIYAPHHAIEPHSLRLGTFAWNGHFILEYAKKHPEFHWIFKPHPRCKVSFVAEGLFKNQQELEEYYNQWAAIGEIYDKGNYMDLFQQTKCLITDCCSFLVEFFPTGQPVIHLKRVDSNDDSIVNKLVAATYYSVFDLPALEKTLHMVLEEGKDPMLQKRIDKLKELALVQAASDNIIKDLEETFSKG